MLEARGWSQKLSVIRSMSDFIHVSHGNPGEEGDMKLRHQNPEESNRLEWYKMPNRKKEKRHQKKGVAVDMWCLTERWEESRRNSETRGWEFYSSTLQDKRHQMEDRTRDPRSKEQLLRCCDSISRKRFHLQSGVISVSLPLQWLKRAQPLSN